MNTVEVVWAPVDGSADQADELLRHEVARHSGVAPASVRIGRMCASCGSGAHGRPHVSLPKGLAPVHASLSRSPDVVVIAFTGAGAIGVDVEPADSPAFAGFDDVALHPGEQAGSVRDRAVLWARKESLLKATGDGLDVAPDSVRLSGPAEEPVLLAWTSTRPRPARVQMADIAIGPRHVAAVTVLGAGDPQVRVREAAPEAPAD